MVRSLVWLLACLCFLGAVVANEETFYGNAAEYSKYDDGDFNGNSKEKSDDENDNGSEEFYDYDDYGDEKDYDSSSNAKFFKKVTKTYMNAPAQRQRSVMCWLGVEYMPHETDCTQFYHCAHRKPYLKTCTSGLYFNPKLNVCDWPHQVDCDSPTRFQYDQNSYPALYNGPSYNYQKSSDNANGNNDVAKKVYYKNDYNNYNDFNYKTSNSYDNNKDDYPSDDDNDGKDNDYSSSQEEDDDDGNSKQYNYYRQTHKTSNKYNNPQKRVFEYYPLQEPQPEPEPEPQPEPEPIFKKAKFFIPNMPFPGYPPPGPTYFRPQGIFNTPYSAMNPPMMNSMSQEPRMMTHNNNYQHPNQHSMYTPMQPQQPTMQDQQPVEKEVTYYYYDDNSQPTKSKQNTYYYYDNGGKQTSTNTNGYWVKKKKIQSGALTNPGYFGKAFQVLQTDRNLMNQPAKYVHHDHTGGGATMGHMTAHDSGSGLLGDDLFKLILLGTPQGSQLLVTSKLLSALGNGKSKKKEGSGSLLKTIFLLNLLNNNAATTQLTPNVQVNDSNQLVAIATGLPVILVNPITGQEVDLADVQSDRVTGQLTDRNGQPLGVLNPLTGELVPAVVPVTTTRQAPVRLPRRRAASTRRTAFRGAGVPLLPRSSSLTSAAGDGVNLVFLSPLTPSSLPPPLSSNSQSATYIRGTLKDLLGDELSRFLTTRSMKVDKPVNSAASSSSGTCSVVRSGEAVTMRLNPQNGRRLSSEECAAMGNLLDKFLPTFLQNFVPDDIPASGLGRKRNSNDNNINTNNNGNAGNGILNIFGRAESPRQALPSLIPTQFNNANNNNNNNNDSNNDNKNNVEGDVFRGIGGNGKSINDFISVRNEVSGCTIAVPSIVTQC